MVGGLLACSVGRCAVVEIPCRMSIYLWSFVLFGFRPVWLGLVGGWSGAHASLHPLSLSTTDDDFFYVMWHGKHETADGQAAWVV
jgi:hypothetical protein